MFLIDKQIFISSDINIKTNETIHTNSATPPFDPFKIKRKHAEVDWEIWSKHVQQQGWNSLSN